MELTDSDLDLLTGARGEGAALAMRVIAGYGRALGAPRLIPITRAHVDGCLYQGDSSIDFAQALATGGARVCVPTTLNVGLVDLLHPELNLGDRDRIAQGRKLMGIYEAMGCAPTWTCAPYQLPDRPGLREPWLPGRLRQPRGLRAIGGGRAHLAVSPVTALQAQAFVAGEALGSALVLDQPLSLWGGADPATGSIIDQYHPQCGMRMAGRVLVMPSGRGSSSSSGALLEMVRRRTNPAAIVLSTLDPILVLGSIAARELYSATVLVLVATRAQLLAIRDKQKAAIHVTRTAP